MRELTAYDVISTALRKDAAGDPRSRLTTEARETLTAMLKDLPRQEPEQIAGYVVKGLKLRVERER